MPQPRRNARRIAPMAALALSAIALVAPGCGLVPKSRLEDARHRVQALSLEVSQLQDVVVNVRAQNRDLARRSLDDARRLRAQDEALARLERAVADYQRERTEILSLLDQIRGQVRTAALEPPTTAMNGRLDAFSRQAGAAFDPARGLLELPADALFASGAATLTPDGRSRLDAIARSLAGPEAPALALSVAAPGEGSGIRLASGTGATDPAALGLERARAIRDHLAARAGIDPTRVAVSSAGRAEFADEDGVARAGGPGPETVTIRVRRLVDAAAPPPSPPTNQQVGP